MKVRGVVVVLVDIASSALLREVEESTSSFRIFNDSYFNFCHLFSKSSNKRESELIVEMLISANHSRAHYCKTKKRRRTSRRAFDK